MTDQIAELTRRVQQLEDINEIQRLQAAYAAACDNLYNPDELCALFTDDGIYDGGETLGVHAGREELWKFFDSAKDTFKWALHFMISPSIEIENEQSARGSWYLLEPATLAVDEAVADYWIASVYDIDYEKTEDGWRFKVMRLAPKLWAEHAKGWGASL